MTTSSREQSLNTLRTPDEWFALGEGLYRDVVYALARYGVHVHPDLRFIPAGSPTPFYAPAKLTIGFGIPDPATAKGRLYWYFIQHLVGAVDLGEVQTAMEVPLPWSVAHEVIHHLRHYYGAPIENDFLEEQVVNCVALALLAEHPRHREGLPALRQWAERMFTQTRQLSPATVPYLAGFRLDIGEVLVAQGTISRATLTRARQLSEYSGATVQEVLIRTGRITAARLDNARAEQAKAEAYFNDRYMASLSEYWLFGTEWLARYLEREDLPSAGDAIELHLLTPDWEASRADATHRLLEQALHSDDAAISETAAEALASHDPSAAIPTLIMALDDPRPTVRATALRTLGCLPRGPAAGTARAQLLLNEEGDVGAAAARLLRLTGIEFTIPYAASPVALAEWALAQFAGGTDTGYQVLGTLLEGDEAAVLAALSALRESGLGPFHDRVASFLNAESATVRASAARALASSATTASALVPLLVDPEPGVQRAAWLTIEACGLAACPDLLAAAALPGDDLRVAALSLAGRLGAPEAAGLLAEMATSLLTRADEMRQIEVAATAHPGLAVMAQAAGEQRWRLARLGVRAIGEATDREALALAERLLDSPDPAHCIGGQEVVRNAFGRMGRGLARMLKPSKPYSGQTSPREVLAACASSEPSLLRALAAYFAPTLLTENDGRRILARLSADADEFVRAEAQCSLRSWGHPGDTQMLTTVEKVLFLRAVPAFASCELEILRGMADNVVAQRFNAGDVVLREGDHGSDMFLVAEGRIAISACGQTVEELGPRQYFGEMALFDGGPRSATATAIEATTLLRLDRDDFHQLGRQRPDLFIGVIQVLSRRLREAMARASAPATTSSGDA
jgi:HEAT repeat protein